MTEEIRYTAEELRQRLDRGKERIDAQFSATMLLRHRDLLEPLANKLHKTSDGRVIMELTDFNKLLEAWGKVAGEALREAWTSALLDADD
jgi:hypothetical protein